MSIKSLAMLKMEDRFCPIHQDVCIGRLCALTTHESTYVSASRITSKSAHLMRWWKCSVSNKEVERDENA